MSVAFELLTVFARLLYGGSASEFIARNDPPFLLQIHHMFWSVPFLLIGLEEAGRSGTVFPDFHRPDCQ